MQYFIMVNDTPVGPMTLSQVFAYNVTTETPVSCDGGPWQPLYTYPELMQTYNEVSKEKSDTPNVNSKKILFGILAILFGSLGIQYFSCGKVAGGFICILLTVVTCGLWELVSLAQGIIVLCMSDEEFKRKFLDNPATFPVW